jgi:hypothetical protein
MQRLGNPAVLGVILGRRCVHRDSEPQYLGVEVTRAVHVGHCEP